MQSELTRNYILDFDEIQPTMVELYVALFGEQHRERIEQDVYQTPITFCGTKETWRKVFEHVSALECNKDKNQKIQTALQYIDSLPDDKEPLQEEYLKVISKAFYLPEQQETSFNEHISDANGFCMIGTDRNKNINMLICFILRNKHSLSDSIIMHEFLHAISMHEEVVDGEIIYYNGLTMPATESQDKGGMDEEFAKKYELSSDLNEAVTQYYTLKLAKEMNEHGVAFIDNKNKGSAYNKALFVMDYLFDRLEPELRQLYINGDQQGLVKLIGEQNYEQIVELNQYFMREADLSSLYFDVRKHTGKFIDPEEYILNADILPREGDRFYYDDFDKIRQVKAIADEIEQKLQRKQ